MNAIEHPISPNESSTRRAREDAGDEEGNRDENDVQNDENKIDETNDDDYINPNHPPAPDAPTRDEWLKHQITHMPYKAWCPICIKKCSGK